LSPFYGILYSTSVIQLHKSLKISHYYIYEAYNIAIAYGRRNAGKAYNQFHESPSTVVHPKFTVYAYKREQRLSTHFYPLPMCSERN